MTFKLHANQRSPQNFKGGNIVGFVTNWWFKGWEENDFIFQWAHIDCLSQNPWKTLSKEVPLDALRILENLPGNRIHSFIYFPEVIFWDIK